MHGPLGMSVDKAVCMKKTAVANASQQDQDLSHMCVICLTKHAFTFHVKFEGDNPIYGTLLYST